MSLTADISNVIDITERLKTKIEGDMGWDQPTGRRHRSNYRVNPGRLDEARMLLKVEAPVQVKVTRLKKANGQYLGLKPVLGVKTHIISLNPRLAVFQADRTIFHELGHALQREEMGYAGFYLGYADKDQRAAMEAEARVWEDLANEHPICELRA